MSSTSNNTYSQQLSHLASESLLEELGIIQILCLISNIFQKLLRVGEAFNNSSFLKLLRTLINLVVEVVTFYYL